MGGSFRRVIKLALINAMREAALLSSSELEQLGRHARESVSAHTLQNGAARFVHCAREAMIWLDRMNKMFSGFTRYLSCQS